VTDPAARLRAAWDAELGAGSGTYSLVLRSDGVVVTRDPDAPHYAASTMKLAVLGAVLDEGLSGPVVVHDRFASAAGGEFTLLQADDQDDWTWARLGRDVALSELADRMITVSGNLAADLVLERIGFDAVRRYLDGLGLHDLRVERLIGDAAAQDQAITNTVTAAVLAELMVHVSTEPSAIALLARQTHLDMIPAGLPAGTWSASKGGWVTGVKHDVALVRPPATPPYVLAVCTTTDLPDPDGMDLVARLSAATWEHWNRWHAS
jgi:beta-lactamase class A